MVYMHIILFVICLNFGMGIAHIPDTPIYIGNAMDTTNVNCYNDFQANGLMTYVNDTADINGVVLTSGQMATIGSTAVGDYDGRWVATADSTNIMNLGQNVNATGYDPITEAIESSYQAGETIKNFLLGGYITNILDHISLTCDFDPQSSTYGQAIDSSVWQYFKTGINIVFGFLIGLAVVYLITGRSFGL